MTKKRPRAHELALECVQPTEDGVLALFARYWSKYTGRPCAPHELPSELLADLRGELMKGLRPLLEEVAIARDPHAFLAPIADELEPEQRAESVDLRPAAVPDIGEEHWLEDTAEVTYEVDTSAIEGQGPAEPGDERETTRPGVNPMPARRSQRPTVRVSNPRLFDPRPTGKTLSSHPPPPFEPERPTVRAPPVLPPRKLPPLPQRRKP